MELGAIPAIRPLVAPQPNRVDRDLSGVFQVEFQREQQESYTPHHQSADRGLEDEDSSPETEEILEAASDGNTYGAPNAINVFA